MKGLIQVKVLQVNCVYKMGSTGKIVYDIHNALQAEGVESIVCYGRGQKEHDKNVYKTSSEIFAKFNALKSRLTGLQYNGSWISTYKLIDIIKREKPDIVHLHCINGYFVNIYRLFDFLKKNKIKTVLTLHAEFMHTGSCGYSYECEKWKTGCANCPQLWISTKSYLFDFTHSAWVKMKKAFDGFDTLKIISVSKWLEDRAKQSPIMEDHNFSVIENGIDTDEIFYPCDFQYLKDKYGLKDEKILLHVTASFSLRENDIKGGRFIAKLAECLKGRNIKIIVVGGSDLTMDLPDNIINVGCIKDQKELAVYYSMADLTVLTSERETFSMVCAESLACGTPIVGFEAGAPETISLPDYSEFVEYGNINKLTDVVYKWIDKKSNGLHADSVGTNYYSKEKMYSEYFKVYSNYFNS